MRSSFKSRAGLWRKTSEPNPRRQQSRNKRERLKRAEQSGSARIGTTMTTATWTEEPDAVGDGRHLEIKGAKTSRKVKVSNKRS